MNEKTIHGCVSVADMLPDRVIDAMDHLAKSSFVYACAISRAENESKRDAQNAALSAAADYIQSHLDQLGDDPREFIRGLAIHVRVKTEEFFRVARGGLSDDEIRALAESDDE